MPPLEAAASLVVLEFSRSYGLGFVATGGRIVTCHHLVVDEPEITAHLADGRALPVRSVAAHDVERDLAVLDAGVLDVRPLVGAGEPSPEARQSVHAFGMLPEEGRARWVDACIENLTHVDPGLSLYALSADVPLDASGGPLLGVDGRVLGVVTIAETEAGYAPLAVPWQHVEPLLAQHRGLPLSTLVREPVKPPAPDAGYPLTLLDGASLQGLEAALVALRDAERRAAHQSGGRQDARSPSPYEAVARRLVEQRGDCPGIRRALAAALARAESVRDDAERAGLLREAVEGLAALIAGFLRTHRGQGAPTLLN